MDLKVNYEALSIEKIMGHSHEELRVIIADILRQNEELMEDNSRFNEALKTVVESEREQMISVIVSGVSHEVRNPLNAILALTEALMQEIKDDSYAVYLEHMRAQANRLSSIMSDLLDLCRPIQLSLMMVEPVTSIIHQTVYAWEKTAKRPQKVQVLYTEESHGWDINVDRQRIGQVLDNILDNACDHSPEDSKIIVSMTNHGDSVSVKIIDKGCGIDPTYVERYFQPFFTTRKGGTGLGLTVVKNNMKVHKGIAKIYNNNPPPGATVELIFPLVKKDGEPYGS